MWLKFTSVCLISNVPTLEVDFDFVSVHMQQLELSSQDGSVCW